MLADDSKAGFRTVRLNPSHHKMFSAWHSFGTESMYCCVKHTQQLWQPKAMYITENGCAATDSIAPDGNVYDTDRIMFLRNNLLHLQRAIAEGVPVRGYFLWSLMNNFEWVNGFGDRFGIVHVDYASRKRTPKMSISYCKEVISRHAVV